MSVIEVQERVDRLWKLKILVNADFLAVDTVDKKMVEYLKTIAKTLLDQETRIMKLEASP